MEHDQRPASEPPKAGYRITEWCRAVGISRPSFYNLTGSLAPTTLRLNSIPIIVEHPADYLRRVAQLQASDQSRAA